MPQSAIKDAQENRPARFTTAAVYFAADVSPTAPPWRPPRQAGRLPNRRPATRPFRSESLESRQLLSGLQATYYDNSDFTGTSITRIDASVSFDWQNGSPDTRIGSDTFSARWVGQVKASYSEQYSFRVKADTAARLWVNNQLLIDTWSSPTSQEVSGNISLEAGKLYDIKLEYREDTGKANVSLRWSSPSQPLVTIPTSALYPPSTPSTASTALDPSPGIAYVKDYGAIGNGIANDAPAIQRAIDALPVFGTLELEPRTYKLNTGLLITKPMFFEGNGALLLSNTSASPQNRTIRVESELNSSTAASWKENIVAGQSTFHPNLPASAHYAVGQWVFLELGQDPYDPHEQHYTTLAPITAMGADGSVTLGIAVPYNINAGAFGNKITGLSTLATQVHIRDVKFDYVDGTIVDSAIWFERVRNSSVDGISGRMNVAVTAADSRNISFTNINDTATNLHSAAGRVGTVWGSDNVQISHVVFDTQYDKPTFFVENWAHGTQLTDVNIRSRLTTTPKSSLFHLTGGSLDTFADQIRVDNAGPVNVVGGGSQPATYSFGTVNIRGTVKSAPLPAINDLTIGANRYAATQHLTKTVNLSANWKGNVIPIFSGTVKSIKITVSNKSALDALYVLNAFGSGANILSSLSSNSAVDLQIFGFIGTDDPFNDSSSSQKSLSIYTPSSVPAGSTVTYDVEYYPPTQ